MTKLRKNGKATYSPEPGPLGTGEPERLWIERLPMPAAVLLGPVLGGIMFLTLPVVTIVAAAWLVVQRLSSPARPRHPALKPTS